MRRGGCASSTGCGCDPPRRHRASRHQRFPVVRTARADLLAAGGEMTTADLSRAVAVAEIQPGTRADELHQLWVRLCDLIDDLNEAKCYEAQVLAERAHCQICRDLKYELEDQRAGNNQG